jgi:uncharacterized protein
MESFLEEIKAEARKLLTDYGTHGFEHTVRVFRTCRLLGIILGADLSVLLPAALLHDVGRGSDDHAIIGAEKARMILKSKGYESKKIERVAEIISTHSFSGGRSPDSKEACILSDADKLDAMGALGIYRAAMFSVEHGRLLEGFKAHFYEKLLQLKDRLITHEAKKMGESRHTLMLNFLEQLEKEVKLEGI